VRSGVGNGVVVAALAAVLFAAVGLARLDAAPAAAASDCASLGQAANFAVLSNGAFNESESSGSSINGRIAAAGDVTLDGVSVNPAAGDSAPTILAGGDFTAGRATGSGGTVNGGVQYGGTSNVAPNFTVNGGLTHAAPPFSFDTEFVSLKELSASLADLAQTPGATVSLNPYSNALELTGTGTGLNVFTVDAAQLAQAAGIVLDLTQPGATALINVTTDTILSIGPMYMNLSGTAGADGVMWNFPLATALAVTRGVAWQGSILAPNATVTSTNHPQLNGQLIGASVPDSNWVINGVKYAGCLPVPPGPPDTTLTMMALCIDAHGDLDVRLRNAGGQTRHVVWNDLTRRDFGQFDVPPHSDQFFTDRGGDRSSLIRATSGTTTVRARGTDRRCEGQITIQLLTEGDAPAGQTWAVRTTNGDNGNISNVLTLASGGSGTVTVPGGYVPGSAVIDEVIGGATYTISVDDPHGALSTSISLNPVVILDDQHEFVTVTLVYESGAPGTGPPEPPVDPEQPTLPPGGPDPPPGPGNGNGTSGADLAVTHQITPSRVLVGGTIQTVTRVVNLGDEPAVGAVAREIPQYHPAQSNSVADVLSLTTTRGTCTQRRPVRCSLGTLAPGATVTMRSRTCILVAAALRSIVVVSSDTDDTNTTNNMATANVRSYLPTSAIQAHIGAPPTGRVGAQLSYQVSVSGGPPAGANTVRLCTQPPSSFVQVSAPGTFKYGGLYCRNYTRVRRGRSVAFTVYGFPSATGRLLASARATAADVARPSRATAPILVGSAAACPAVARPAARGKRPIAHAAC
jgi:choice-of-anchor A domain-containing protein